MKYLLIVILIIVTFIETGKSIEISKMQTNDVLHIRFESIGCFNHSLFNLVIKKNGKGAKLTGIDNSPFYNKNTKKTIKDRNLRLNTIFVSNHDLKRLDKLLEFYRNIEGDGCTSVDSITVIHKRFNKQIDEEKFEDGTCSLEDKKLLTLYKLIAKIKPSFEK